MNRHYLRTCSTIKGTHHYKWFVNLSVSLTSALRITVPVHQTNRTFNYQINLLRLGKGKSKKTLICEIFLIYNLKQVKQTKWLFTQIYPSVFLNNKYLSIKVTNSTQSHNPNLVTKTLNMAYFFTKNKTVKLVG